MGGAAGGRWSVVYLVVLTKLPHIGLLDIRGRLKKTYEIRMGVKDKTRAKTQVHAITQCLQISPGLSNGVNFLPEGLLSVS